MAKKEKPFHRQTPAEKRVTIARDVLKWLATGKLVASPGTYLEVWKTKEDAKRSEDGDYYEGMECLTNAKTINGYACTACALGGVFAAAVERNKRLNHGESLYCVGSGSMRNELAPYFPLQQLWVIENAFEQCSINPGAPGHDAYKSENPTVRMRAIMNNIIRNDGEFILPRHCENAGLEREQANQIAA